jgi:hypothetical protein
MATSILECYASLISEERNESNERQCEIASRRNESRCIPTGTDRQSEQSDRQFEQSDQSNTGRVSSYGKDLQT